MSHDPQSLTDAANIIVMEIHGDHVSLKGVFDLKGLGRLQRLIESLEAILATDDEADPA